MTTQFPECAKCEQHAVIPDGPGGFLVCAACGEFTLPSEVGAETMADAVEAMDKWEREHAPLKFREFWAQKKAREAEKVARLAEGRW